MFFGFNMGPRGRMFGHRGFRPGIFAGIIGLIFFGWIILAVLAAALGSGIMILGSMAAVLARFLPRILAVLASSKGFAVGIVIGLLLYFRNRRKNTEKEADEKETRTGGENRETAAAEEIIEAPAYRSFRA